uniref:DUF2887 domain-containing protein n=1 Tax=Oscillatoriales cyanobacterium SpSt-402 TaxID=2282168 RepID=A0A832H454_9CYAN
MHPQPETIHAKPLKTDSLFYRIFQTSPAAFFDLIGTPNTNAADYRFTSEEVKQTSFKHISELTKTCLMF